jgi:SAM-dependent methyltransferase
VQGVLEGALRHPTDPAGRALDLGCGAGRHAELLASMGFEVELVDLSADMLRISADRIGVLVPSPADMRNLPYPLGMFDVIVAAESVMHLTHEEIPPLLVRIRQLLRPGGVAYLRFQIGNNALISTDGRYYVYCPDDGYARNLVKNSGLVPFVDMSVPVEAYETAMYPSATAWTWHDFCCRPAAQP